MLSLRSLPAPPPHPIAWPTSFISLPGRHLHIHAKLLRASSTRVAFSTSTHTCVFSASPTPRRLPALSAAFCSRTRPIACVAFQAVNNETDFGSTQDDATTALYNKVFWGLASTLTISAILHLSFLFVLAFYGPRALPPYLPSKNILERLTVVFGILPMVMYRIHMIVGDYYLAHLDRIKGRAESKQENKSNRP